MALQITHILRDLDIASGGPSRSVPALAQNQAKQEGVKISVFYQDRGNPVIQLPDNPVNYQAISGRRSQIGRSLNSLAGGKPVEPGILHIHGLWRPLLHHSASWARAHNIPYVISTRGMLANWALGHKAAKKKIAWHLYQKRDLAEADCLLASSESERKDIESLLSGKQVVAIPNGCEDAPVKTEVSGLLPCGSGIRWALAMGRLHPVKGYAELIEAWASLGPRHWKLAIAGPDEDGYRAHLKTLIDKHDLAEKVFLPGEVDDTRKWSLFDQCELFIAPSKTENFGMAIAEALQSGTPVITTRGTPWHELLDHRCGWWIEHGVPELRAALAEATQLDATTLRTMGENGHRLISAQYSWGSVAAKTLDLYQAILERP